MRKVPLKISRKKIDYSAYCIDKTGQTFRTKTELDPYLIPYTTKYSKSIKMNTKE